MSWLVDVPRSDFFVAKKHSVTHKLAKCTSERETFAEVKVKTILLPANLATSSFQMQLKLQ